MGPRTDVIVHNVWYRCYCTPSCIMLIIISSSILLHPRIEEEMIINIIHEGVQ